MKANRASTSIHEIASPRLYGMVNGLTRRRRQTARLIVASLLAVVFSCQALLLAAGPAAKSPFMKTGATTPFVQGGDVITVFSTPSIIRDNGKPQPARFQFALPAAAVAPFNLRVESGAANPNGRTLSATVRLNGKVVVQFE